MATVQPIALGALPRRSVFDYMQQYQGIKNSQLQNTAAKNALMGDALQRVAQGVLNSPEPESAYQMALQRLQVMGVPGLENVPQQWGPEAEMLTKMYAMPEAERTEFERTLEMLPQEERLNAVRQKLGVAPEVRSVGDELVRVGPGGAGAESIYSAPEKPDYRTVGGDLVEVGPGGVKPIYSAPEKPPEPLALERRAAAAGLEKGTPEFEDFMLRGGPPEEREMPDFEDEQKVRKEFTSLTGEYRDVRNAYSRIKASAKDPSAAGDLALIFNYMKMLDPESVVRESEFATAAASGSYGARIQSLVNKALSGQRLSEDIRRDFVSRADRLYRAQQKQFQRDLETFREIAGSAGLDPERTVPDFSDIGESVVVPPEVIESMASQPPGTRVVSPDGQTFIWDGETLQPE